MKYICFKDPLTTSSHIPTKPDDDPVENLYHRDKAKPKAKAK
jgi:hypothetical protein